MEKRVRGPNTQHRFDIVSVAKYERWAPDLGSVMARNAHIAARKFAARIKRLYKIQFKKEMLEPDTYVDIDIVFNSAGYALTYGNQYTYTVSINRKDEEECKMSARIGPGIQRDKTIDIKGVQYSVSYGAPVRDAAGKTIPLAKTAIVSEYYYRVKMVSVKEFDVRRKRGAQTNQ